MFNKVLGGAYNFIKKETLAQVFSCEFWEIFKSTFFTEHLRETATEWEIFLVPLTHFVLKFPFKVSARFKMKSLRQNVFCVNDTIKPWQLFVEKRQFFSQNNQWLNNIIYH